MCQLGFVNNVTPGWPDWLVAPLYCATVHPTAQFQIIRSRPLDIRRPEFGLGVVTNDSRTVKR